MSDAITLRNMLNLEEFDPLAIDISEFDSLARSMPRDANFDIAIAETLAVQYLRAADRCSEILSMLMWYEERAKVGRNTVKQRLYLLRTGFSLCLSSPSVRWRMRYVNSSCEPISGGRKRAGRGESMVLGFDDGWCYYQSREPKVSPKAVSAGYAKSAEPATWGVKRCMWS